MPADNQRETLKFGTLMLVVPTFPCIVKVSTIPMPCIMYGGRNILLERNQGCEFQEKM